MTDEDYKKELKVLYEIAKKSENLDMALCLLREQRCIMCPPMPTQSRAVKRPVCGLTKG